MLQGILSIMVARGNGGSATTKFYRSLTLDQPGSDLTDFPVLFTGTFTYLKTVANGGKVQNSNGYDIVFYSDSALTTKLKFERVGWDAATGTCEFWIKIPTLASASPTVIYISYGDVTITTDQQDKINTWDTNYKGVYHLADGTTLNVNDSTGVNNGTNHSAVAGTGQIDGCVTTDGTNYIGMSGSGTLNITGDLTISCWIKRTGSSPSFPNLSIPFSKRDLNGGSNDAWYFRWNGASGSASMQFAIFNGSVEEFSGTTSTLTNNTWYYICGTFNSAGKLMTIYINGSSDGTHGTANSGINSNSTEVRIGGTAYTGSPSNIEWWVGSIDEVRASNTLRSSDWIAAEYSNQNDPSNFYIIGSETPA